jgi:hypothetical protein
VDALLKHGLIVTLLVALLIYTEWQRHATLHEVNLRIDKSEERVMACQNEMIRLYRDDRQQTLDVIHENAEIMRQVKIALER